MATRTADRPQARRYHHGDLKTALIQAAGALVAERGVEAFSVADAARAAGVSSGAPYRHFADREDLLDHVAADGFDRLRAVSVEAMAPHPAGSVAGLIAGGCAYVDFCSSNRELFHLMWGATRIEGGAARASGDACHQAVVDRFRLVFDAVGLGHLDAYAVSGPLWAMVHGYASLLLGPADKLPSDRAAIHGSIAVATRAYLDGLTKGDAARAFGAGGGPRAPC